MLISLDAIDKPRSISLIIAANRFNGCQNMQIYYNGIAQDRII
jgi:hypothetical protein